MTDRYQQAKKATLVSALINTTLAILKVIIGFLGHSQALIADGIHSFSDLLCDAFVLVAAKAGNKEPDSKHPYGHQRIETLAVIVIALLLIGVGIALSYNTLHALWQQEKIPLPTIYTLWVAGISILANEWLYRYMLQIANAIDSNLLRSNAWHNRSDALSSLIVFIAVLGELFGIPYLDNIGAVLISLLIMKMGIQMIWKSVSELIDTAVDPDTLSNITETIRRVPGVVDIHQLRTRLLGGQTIVDVHLIVDPLISVSEGHYISEQVYLSLQKQPLNITDATVHIDPENDELSHHNLSLPNRKQLINWIRTQDNTPADFDEQQLLQLHYLDGHIEIDLVLPKQYINEKTMVATYEKILLSNPIIQKIRFFYR